MKPCNTMTNPTKKTEEKPNTQRKDEYSVSFNKGSQSFFIDNETDDDRQISVQIKDFDHRIYTQEECLEILKAIVKSFV